MKTTQEILKSKQTGEFLEKELFYKKGESEGKSIAQLWAEFRRERNADRDNHTKEY